MNDERIPGGSGNQNKGLSLQVPEPPELCHRVCTKPLSQLTRTTMDKLRVGQPANGFYLLLRTLEPTIKGVIDFEFGPNLLVLVEDNDKNRIYFCLHAHVHLRSETELEDLLPLNTVFVLKEPLLLASPEKRLAVVVGSPSDLVLVGCSHVLYEDAEALGWRPKLEGDGANHLVLEWKAKGDSLFQTGKFDEAVDVYLFALTVGGDNVTNVSINQNLAQVFFELGCYERAIMHCHKVFDSAPINQIVLNLVGLSHYELRQFTEAMFYFGGLSTIWPSNQVAAGGLVRCQERLREAEGNVDVVKLFRACQTDTTTPIDHGNVMRNIAFREGPNNERGVYATEDMGPGTLILVSIFVRRFPSECGHVDFMRAAFRAVIKNPMSVGRKLYGLPGGRTLTEEEKRIFCEEVDELEPIVDVLRLYGLIKRNLVVIKQDMVQNAKYWYHVLDVASRFRHSCLPNCTFVFYKDLFTVRTCTSVKKGEELFLFFSGIHLSFQEKREAFERMGYECGCHLCALDKLDSNEVHDMREALKTKFYTQMAICVTSPDTAEAKLLPIVQELVLTYGVRNWLRPIPFQVFCDLARQVDRSSENWKSTVTYCVEMGLRSLGLSLDHMLRLADEVNPQFTQWVFIPEVFFEYAALMDEVESSNGHHHKVLIPCTQVDKGAFRFGEDFQRRKCGNAHAQISYFQSGTLAVVRTRTDKSDGKSPWVVDSYHFLPVLGCLFFLPSQSDYSSIRSFIL